MFWSAYSGLYALPILPADQLVSTVFNSSGRLQFQFKCLFQVKPRRSISRPRPNETSDSGGGEHTPFGSGTSHVRAVLENSAKPRDQPGSAPHQPWTSELRPSPAWKRNRYTHRDHDQTDRSRTATRKRGGGGPRARDREANRTAPGTPEDPPRPHQHRRDGGQGGHGTQAEGRAGTTTSTADTRTQPETHEQVGNRDPPGTGAPETAEHARGSATEPPGGRGEERTRRAHEQATREQPGADGGRGQLAAAGRRKAGTRNPGAHPDQDRRPTPTNTTRTRPTTAPRAQRRKGGDEVRARR